MSSCEYTPELLSGQAFCPTDPAKFLAATYGRVTGPLADAVAWTEARSRRSQPVLATLAWLTAFSAVMRGYATPTDLRANLQVVGVAPSAAGKDSARKAIVKAFAAAGLRQHIGAEEVMSAAGLVSAVREQPSILYLLDEFGHMFRGFIDPRAPRHIADIGSTFTKLFTSSAGDYLGRDYADRKLTPRAPIVEPCVSLYGTATHRQFLETLRSDKIDDGTLARFIVYDAGDTIPPSRGECDFSAPAPETVVAALRRLVDRAAGAGEMPGISSASPGSVVLGMEPAAAELLARLDAWVDEQVVGRATEASPIIGRMAEHACKLALVFTLACDPDAEAITVAGMQFGIDVSRNSLGTILQGAERYAAVNEREANEKRCLEAIRRAGGRGLVARDVNRALGGVSQRDRADILASLEEAGDIIKVDKRPGRLGRTPAGIYVHAAYYGAWLVRRGMEGRDRAAAEVDLADAEPAGAA